MKLRNENYTHSVDPTEWVFVFGGWILVVTPRLESCIKILSDTSLQSRCTNPTTPLLLDNRSTKMFIPPSNRWTPLLPEIEIRRKIGHIF